MRGRTIKFAQLIAWTSIVIIAYFTLTRVGIAYSIYYRLSPYVMHPSLRTFAHFEHVIIFALFGASCSAAYPRRFLAVCCIVAGSAVALELLQTVTADRHGTIVDAFEKAAGGLFGAYLAKVALNAWGRRALTNNDP
jgi:VanZ family protein